MHQEIENGEKIISTQETIEDARIKHLTVKNCDYKTGSITFLNRHIKNAHEYQDKEEISPKRLIRKRIKCEQCEFICTSEIYIFDWSM